MIFMKTENAYYGLATKFSKALDLTDKTLVVQYELRVQDIIDCGGAYIKLFSDREFSPLTLSNETRYKIMFGPDKCTWRNRIHFIFNYKHPLTGEVEEKSIQNHTAMPTDKLTHLYTLVVRPDNTWEIWIDTEIAHTGSLLKDMKPPVNPPKMIVDTKDRKPPTWVEKTLIDDPNARKPDDWDETQPEFIPKPGAHQPDGWLVDEPKTIPDPDAVRPANWDDNIQGTWWPPEIVNPKCEKAPGCGPWEPPLIRNRLFRGKWLAPKIANPAYRGPWKPRMIPNPNYFEDLDPHNFEPIIGAGFEVLMGKKDVGINNIYIGTDEDAVREWNAEHFLRKKAVQDAEQAKITPSPSPEAEPPTPTRIPTHQYEKGDGFSMAFSEAARQIQDALFTLWEESPRAVMITGGALGLIASLLLILCLRGLRASHRGRRHRRLRSYDYEEEEGEPEKVVEDVRHRSTKAKK
jgi:calnexin